MHLREREREREIGERLKQTRYFHMKTFNLMRI